MKRILSLAVLILGTAAAAAQPVDLTSGRRAVRASMAAVYERYEEDEVGLSQLAFPVAVDLPLGREWSASLRVSRAETTGDSLETLSGLTDAQVVLRYARAVGDGSLVVGLGANLPTGRDELAVDQFATAIAQSQSALGFEAQSLGQGFGVSPALTWAFPVGERLAAGLGAAYQHRGPYRPVEGIGDDYVPGDELLLTAGLDVEIGPSTSVSVDVTHTIYGADRLGDEDVYEAGDKSTVAVLLRGFRVRDEWRLLALYRTRARSDDLAGVGPVTGDDRILPNEMALQASYGLRIGGAIDASLIARLRRYDETPVYPSRTLFDAGVLPSFELSGGVAVTSRFVYTLGTLTGLEVGVGLALDL